MNRNQDRIEGNYSIVSVFQSKPDWNTNDCAHMDTLKHLLRKGFRVQELKGVWNGVEERSIRIEGIGHAEEARCIALTYNQDAYITVADKAAVLRSWSNFTNCYQATNTFTRQVEAGENTQNYTEAQGYRFVFGV